MNNNDYLFKGYRSGFVALFFILSVSTIFLFYIYLSSERVFEYIRIKDVFSDNKLKAYDLLTCADSFVNNLIRSDFNIHLNDIYSFSRNMYFDDDYICYIEGIDIYSSDDMDVINFIINNKHFKYILKDGFVDFNNNSKLF